MITHPGGTFILPPESIPPEQWCDPHLPVLIKNVEHPTTPLARRPNLRLLARQAPDAFPPRAGPRHLLPAPPVAPPAARRPPPADRHRPRRPLPAGMGLRLPVPLRH